MTKTQEDYLRELKVHLDTKNWTDCRANERILRTVEETQNVRERDAHEFRRQFAIHCYLYGEETAFKNMLPDLDN